MVTKEHRQERAKEDARTSNEFARAGAQATILINGGAATAILAFFSAAVKDSGVVAGSILSIIPVSLALYSLGVFFGAAALPIASKSVEYYMENWERGEGGTAGTVLWYVTLICIGAGLLFFLGSSLYLAYELRLLRAS